MLLRSCKTFACLTSAEKKSDFRMMSSVTKLLWPLTISMEILHTEKGAFKFSETLSA